MTFLSKAVVAAANERAKNLAEQVPPVPKGHAILKLTKVGLSKTKEKGYVQVILESSDPENRYRPITQNYIIADAEGQPSLDWMIQNLEKLSGFFLGAFDHEMQDAETPELFVKQFTKFAGQKFQAAVQWRLRVWQKSEQEMILTADVSIRYTGNITKDQLSVNEDQMLVLPTAEDHALWNRFTGKKTDRFKVMNSEAVAKEEKKPIAAPPVTPMAAAPAPVQDTGTDAPPSHAHVELDEDPFK